jgi:hypothetical protein
VGDMRACEAWRSYENIRRQKRQSSRDVPSRDAELPVCVCSSSIPTQEWHA